MSSNPYFTVSSDPVIHVHVFPIPTFEYIVFDYYLKRQYAVLSVACHLWLKITCSQPTLEMCKASTIWTRALKSIHSDLSPAWYLIIGTSTQGATTVNSKVQMVHWSKCSWGILGQGKLEQAAVTLR
jgi:hypothetical protein